MTPEETKEPNGTERRFMQHLKSSETKEQLKEEFKNAHPSFDGVTFIDWLISKLLEKDEIIKAKAGRSLSMSDELKGQIQSLESQLSKEREAHLQCAFERNEWLGKFQKERELREAGDVIVDAYKDLIDSFEEAGELTMLPTGINAAKGKLEQYNNLKNQGK